MSAQRSRAEIERSLTRFQDDEFAYGYDKTKAVVQFTSNGRLVRFVLILPPRDDEKFRLTPTGKLRSGSAAQAAWEQGCRESWRALAAVIKAKLVAVDTGIVGFDEEFASLIVLPDGTTVGEWLTPRIEKAYELGTVPPVLAIDK